MKNCLVTFHFFLVSLAFTFCTEKDPIPEINGKVEFYSLEQYETVDNSFQIDEKTVVLKDAPLIMYKDLISYNAKEFFFSFSENGKSIVKNMQHSVHGVAIAIVANNQVIYTAYFWPGYSSMSCPWITIDPIGIEYRGKGYVRLGYPGPHDGFIIPDKRNDPMILEVFMKDGKLIE